MDSTFHAAVSSSHTSSVLSWESEALTLLRISGFQRPLSFFLRLGFSLAHCSIFPPYCCEYVRLASLPANILKDFFISTLYLSAALQRKPARERLLLPGWITGVSQPGPGLSSQPPVSRGLETSLKTFPIPT